MGCGCAQGMPLTIHKDSGDNLLSDDEDADMPTDPREQHTHLMTWRPLVRFLPIALFIDGVVIYLGWWIWKTALH